MKKLILSFILILILITSCGPQPIPDNSNNPPKPIPTSQKNNIIIGVEYAFPGTGNAFSEVGISGVKFYPEQYTMWEKLQAGPDKEIDFSRLDAMVKEYQNAGMTDIVMGTRHNSPWASIDSGKLSAKNPLPKKEYEDDYVKFLSAMVERYDHDGVDDMPGLRAPIKYYEIGVEFSTYEPENVDDYIKHLQVAYDTAHKAYPDVVIAHVAFLPWGAFDNDPSPAQYESAFRNLPDNAHGLDDMRKILDHPEAFDVVNVHSLAEPTEPEKIMKWVQYEMKQRNYEKPVIISDTALTAFVAYGPGNNCKGLLKGKMFYPATEADRCRVGEYFQKLIDEDPDTLAWAYGYIASDVVKRVVVAADSGFVLIDTAYTEDLELFKKIIPAGTGNSGWGGFLEVTRAPSEQRTVIGKRPSFYALKQLNGHLNGYSSIERIDMKDPEVRVYEIKKNKETFYIAWVEPTKLFLPEDTIPTKTIDIPLSGNVKVEHLITEQSQTIPNSESVNAKGITLTPTPIFIFKN